MTCLSATSTLAAEESDENPKAWEQSTLYRYDGIRRNWISPAIGQVRLSQVSEEHIDRCFAKMRRLGASRSHMNQVRSLLSGAFKWAPSGVGTRVHTAGGMAARLRVGMVAAPEGTWQLEARGDGGGSGLWARYTPASGPDVTTDIAS